MTNQLFEKAKQTVAEKHKPATWVKTVCENEPVMSFVREIVEHACNEAVKADRENIHNWLNRPPIDFGRDNVNHVLKNRHIPFPQQPDGI